MQNVIKNTAIGGAAGMTGRFYQFFTTEPTLMNMSNAIGSTLNTATTTTMPWILNNYYANDINSGE